MLIQKKRNGGYFVIFIFLGIYEKISAREAALVILAIRRSPKKKCKITITQHSLILKSKKRNDRSFVIYIFFGINGNISEWETALVILAMRQSQKKCKITKTQHSLIELILPKYLSFKNIYLSMYNMYIIYIYIHFNTHFNFFRTCWSISTTWSVLNSLFMQSKF